MQTNAKKINLKISLGMYMLHYLRINGIKYLYFILNWYRKNKMRFFVYYKKYVKKSDVFFLIMCRLVFSVYL